MVGLVEGPEPRALQVDELRSDRRERIDEAHALQLRGRQVVPGDQVPDLVLRVVQDQPDLIELIGRAQADDEALEELCERSGSQQLELALLGLAKQRVVAAHLLGERGEPRLEHANFLFHRLGALGGARVIGQRPGMRSAHGAKILQGPQARRSA